MRECWYVSEEREEKEKGRGTENNFLCQVLTRIKKKKNLHARTDACARDNALAYVQGPGPWTEKNQSGSSVGDSRESGSSEKRTNLLLRKMTLSRC